MSARLATVLDVRTEPRPARARPAMSRPSARRVRQPFDRRELERSGWRTTIEYRENLVRSNGGQLAHVVIEWRAEGERVGADGEIDVVVAVGQRPATAWSRLRAAAEQCQGGASRDVGDRR